jgi:uncharacterized protein
MHLLGRRFFARLFCCALVLLGSAQAWAQPLQTIPKLVTRVTDATGTLTATDKAALEAKLLDIEQRKGSQVAVLIVSTTQPEAIEQYSLRVVEAWKLGRAVAQGKKVDDGILLLVAKDDRKVRIEVGYGLEGVLPDAYAKRIIAEQITPRFKAGDFSGGLTQAVTKIAAYIDGAGLPEPTANEPNRGGQKDTSQDLMGLLIPLGVIALFTSIILGRVLGSLATGGAAAFLTAGTALPPLLAFGGAAVATFILASILLGNKTARSGIRRSPVFMPGGFGGGGGGWGSGSGGGGGFSGGGGGFGGGGASGDW